MTVHVHYLLGLGRSGSTVIGRALAVAVDAVPGDEVMAVWQRGVLEDRVCSCGEPFSSCPYWRAVVATSPSSFDPELAQRVVAEVHRVMGVFGPMRAMTRRRRAALVESVPAFWFEAMAALYRGIATVGGRDTIVDTSKAPVLACLLARVPGVRVRSALVVRDPRRVARSWGRPPKLPEGAHELPTLAPWKTAVVWLLGNVAGERVQQVQAGPPSRTAPRPDRASTVVRLEDFTADPRAVVTALAHGLGVATVDLPDPFVIPTTHHTMSGHPTVRFAEGPLTVRAATPLGSRSWPDRLVTLIDLPLLRRYGYPLRGGS